MQKSVSLEKIKDKEFELNARNTKLLYKSSDVIPRRRRFVGVRSSLEQYSVTIKPRLTRCSSLSDLTADSCDINLDYLRQTNGIRKGSPKYLFHDTCGDTADEYEISLTENIHMSWNSKANKQKKKAVKKMDTYGIKYAGEFAQCSQAVGYETTISSTGEESSISSTEVVLQKGAAFPFVTTPSGNLKVNSNQVVFQSSTVGVLLADPSQAKIKVKFKGKPTGEPTEEDTIQDYTESENDQVEDFMLKHQSDRSKIFTNDKNTKSTIRSPGVREDKGKDLASLGYATAEPVDWSSVQLPTKTDVVQEVFRRIHNYVNTDTLVHIGDDTFHCHHLILEVYSAFFDNNNLREIELPASDVSAETFQTIYEWMILSGADSPKALRRDNVLDLFSAAQCLAIKELEDQCWNFITNENTFTEDTAFALYRQARGKGMKPVMELMLPRIMKFFLPLVASKDFLELVPDDVMAFLCSNYICVTSEIEVLMAGVRWLYGDWPARKRYSIDVMRCVRFGHISPWQLVDIKRNPDNGEVLEIVNVPEVQQMVDDGLAYVIIRYWYGNNSKNYYHWIDVLGLTEPADRNWIGEETNHVTYKDFLKYLEKFMIPKDQMNRQFTMMPATRRNDDAPASMRGGGAGSEKMDLRRPKFEFPLPAALRGLSFEKGNNLPLLAEMHDIKRNIKEHAPVPIPESPPSVASRSPNWSPPPARNRRQHLMKGDFEQPMLIEIQRQPQPPPPPPPPRKPLTHQILMCTTTTTTGPYYYNEGRPSCTERKTEVYDPPERDDSCEELAIENSDDSNQTLTSNNSYLQIKGNRKRHSVAANYLASATAGLSGNRKLAESSPHEASTSKQAATSAHDFNEKFISPDISLYHSSKASIARVNMNKLSNSILGPSNKNYIVEGSLFNWDRETVLVFGGIDPHAVYGVGRNTGKDIYRFDPLLNIWEVVGELPEPRHHHSVAFLRGRVYLVGGADPRDDDIRGKSVVVSTVWSYEPVTRSWYSESGLATPRKNFGLVVHRMALYAIGGQDKKGRVLRSVEKFDPRTGAWSEVRPMIVGRMAVAATKYREYIWVAGGMTGERKKPLSRTVECYNSKTNQWTEIHNLRFPRCFGTLFAMNDKLYLVGGAGRLTDKEKTATSVGAIDVWDWTNREWRQQTDMSIPRHGHALAYLGTQLLILGGVTTIYMRALSNVESFCCERGAWIRGVATLPSPLSGHGAITLPPASLM